MAVFTRQIATAQRLIKKYGKVVTWRQVTDGAAADPAKPWKHSAASNVDNTVSIVFIPEKRIGYEWLARLTGTEVPDGAGLAYMAAQAFAPTLHDVIVYDGTAIRLASIDPLAPNGEIILYTLRLQR